MTIEKAVGRELQFCRTKKGISQEKLGFEASLHRTYISLIERGMKSPTLNAIFRICEALEIPPERFVMNVRLRLSGKRD
jgi:transcriptional regulator with XRE-family HTH domain